MVLNCENGLLMPKLSSIIECYSRSFKCAVFIEFSVKIRLARAQIVREHGLLVQILVILVMPRWDKDTFSSFDIT